MSNATNYEYVYAIRCVNIPVLFACNFSIKEENKEGRFVLIFAKLLDLVKAVDNVP